MATKKGYIEPVTCPFCEDFSTKRHTMLKTHLEEKHNLGFQEAYDKAFGGPALCRCGCGKPTNWTGWTNGYQTALCGHSSNIYSFYPPERAKEISENRKAKLRGKTSWAKGLTKETDVRIKLRGEATAAGRKKAFDEGRIAVWSKGLTKETDERVATAAEKSRQDFASGSRTMWHDGLTESTDDRVRAKNDDLRRRYASGELENWAKGKTAEDDPRIAKTWLNRDAMREYAHIRFSDQKICEILSSNTSLRVESIEGYKNDRIPAINVSCSHCDYRAKVSLIFAKNDRCPKCCALGSKGQLEVQRFVESFGFNVAANVKGIVGNRQELDIYVPEKKLAIEYNGLYWHSEQAGKGIDYHQNKSDRCADVGVNLFHVFEDEWRDKRPIVESMLRHRLGMTTDKVNARDCTLRDLTVQERRSFFETNHVDGDTNARLAVGLIDRSGRIVSAMSLRLPFHRKKHGGRLEVARMCSALDVSVRGGLSKLTQACRKRAKERGFTELLSYVDGRFGPAPTWQLSGWIKGPSTSPRFWWTDDDNRYNRFRYKADKARGMTEAQVAEEANVVRIYNCRNMTFTLAC